MYTPEDDTRKVIEKLKKIRREIDEAIEILEKVLKAWQEGW